VVAPLVNGPLSGAYGTQVVKVLVEGNFSTITFLMGH
jgi:hypothetical protein